MGSFQLNSKSTRVVITVGAVIAMQVGCRNSMNLPPRASQVGAKQPIEPTARDGVRKKKMSRPATSSQPVQGGMASSDFSPPEKEAERERAKRENTSMAAVDEQPSLTDEQEKMVQSVVELTSPETPQIREPEGSAKPPPDAEMIEVEPIKRVLPGPEGLIAGREVVKENDSNRTIQSDGGDVVIAGDDGVIVLSGGCGTLVVEGSNNQIQGDVVLQLEVTGSNNTLVFGSIGKGKISGDRNDLSWKKGIAGGDPSISDVGEGNVTRRSE